MAGINTTNTPPLTGRTVVVVCRAWLIHLVSFDGTTWHEHTREAVWAEFATCACGTADHTRFAGRVVLPGQITWSTPPANSKVRAVIGPDEDSDDWQNWMLGREASDEAASAAWEV